MSVEEVVLRTRTRHGLRPFAHRYGVQNRSKSQRLQRVLSDFGSEDSFAQANQRIKEHYGFELHASAVRTATLKHAERAGKILQSEYAQTYRSLPAHGPEVMLVEVDGSMICTVPAGRKRNALRERIWQEIRLAAAQPVGSIQTTFAATFGSVQETGNRWGHTAKTAGRGINTRLHAVADGAEWIAQQTRAVFGAEATLLTDYYHVSEYLAAAARTCRPANPERWRHTQQKRLKTGASAKVIIELAAHIEPAESAEENAPVRAAHRYLSNRCDTLDYASALAAGLPIGSGLIESAHKHVLQARLKLPGAAWLQPNAEAIAQLRVFRSNDRWDELWPLAA